MPISILMPALSPTMTEGTLAKWLKKEGEAVKSGDAIAEIETDKASMEMEAADDGVLGKILVPAGTAGVKVNQPIALLLEEGEDKSALAKTAAPAAAAAAAPPVMPAKAAETKSAAPAPKTGRVVASPLAKRLAQNAGLDLSRVAGSGPHGRIVKRDVEAVSTGKLPMLASAAVPARVRTLLRRCLTRDVMERLRDIGEARVALGVAAETERPAVPPNRGASIGAP